MRTLVSRPFGRALRAGSLGALLLGGSLLSACGGATATPAVRVPGNFAAAPAAAGTPGVGPEVPQPRGNATSSGSFGPALSSLPLPAGPTATSGAAAATARPGGAAGSGQPAAPTPAAAQPGTPGGGTSASTQNRTVPADRLNLRNRVVYGAGNMLWSAARDGSDRRVVLAKPNENGPVAAVSELNPSPDGTRLLYTVGANTATPAYHLLDLTKGTLADQPYNGAWAADNTHIITSKNGRLVVLNVETGAQEDLGEGSNANWTAAGQIIAVRQGNIWLIPYPASNGTPRQLTSFATAGDKVWGFSNRLLYHYLGRILFAGGERDQLGAQGNGLGIWSLDIASGRLTQLAATADNNIVTLMLSPSGREVAWAGQSHSSACASYGDVGWTRADLAGRSVEINPAQTDANFFMTQGLTWISDAAGLPQVVFARQDASCGATLTTGATKLYRVDPAAPGTLQYLMDGSSPTWLPPVGLGMINPGAVARR